jgi:hypothetical protein
MSDLIGATVIQLGWRDGALVFVTDKGTFAYEAEGDCCSSSWFEHMSGVQALIGSTVREVSDIDLPDVMEDVDFDESKYDVLAYYGIRIVSDGGYSDIDYRNDSNGYYGGYIVKSSYDSIDTEITDDF